MTHFDRIPFTTADRGAESNAVTSCPFCHSPRVTTASKTVTDSTYWRCAACGEIWNPARAQVRRPVNRWR
jgi:hypothetical protein